MVFSGFKKCLFPCQKFDSDPERLFSIILEDDQTVKKWFKPNKGQFQIYYKIGQECHEYQPDFVAEAEGIIYLCEPKARNEIQDSVVQAKKDTAVEWCTHATTHSNKHKGKPWKYILVPHDAIQTNRNLKSFADEFGL